MLSVTIPGTTSHYAARPAEVWVPKNDTDRLPVLMMLHGTSGGPTDWPVKGHIVSVVDAFAKAHGGQAPLVVMPDINGQVHADTECIRTKSGASVEDYLEHDVPSYIAAHFPVLSAPAHWAIGGLSEGGTCAVVLALRDPAQFSVFVDLSGLSRPSVTDYDNPDRTTAVLFGGSVKEFEEHDPVYLMTHHSYPQLSGFFECGAQDKQVAAAQRRLVAAAHRAGITLIETTTPGTHSWKVWNIGIATALPWVWDRIRA